MADNRPNGDRGEGFSWLLIVGSFIVAWPLGLVLLGLKLWDGGGKKPQGLTAGERERLREASRRYTPVDRPVIDVEPDRPQPPRRPVPPPPPAAQRRPAPPPFRPAAGRPAPPRPAAPRPAPPSSYPPPPPMPPKPAAPPPVKSAAAKPAAVKTAAKSLTRTPRTSRRKSKLLKIGGIIAMAVGSIILTDAVDSLLFWGAELEYIWGAAQAAAVTLAGAIATFSGFRMAKRQRRNEQYFALLGQKEVMAFGQLSRMMGLPEGQVTKDMRDMWDRGDLPDGAFLDLEQGKYYASFQAAEDDASRQAQAAERERLRESAPPPQSESGWLGLLRGIRRANDSITDPALSARVDRIADLGGRILRVLEEDPEKEQQVHGFLDYYLPTTKKLLDSYASFEAAGVDTESLTAAKARISEAMEQLEEGYRHQLDALYAADTMDVETEIRVMEAMLQRDLGSVEKDFGLRG